MHKNYADLMFPRNFRVWRGTAWFEANIELDGFVFWKKVDTFCCLCMVIINEPQCKSATELCECTQKCTVGIYNFSSYSLAQTGMGHQPY